MKPGDEVDIKIIGTSGNYGLGLRAGMIIFVPEVNQGDYVKVRIKEVRKAIIYAEHVSDLEPTKPEYTEKEEEEDYPGYEFEPDS